jgi:hypothetical protein
MTYGMWSGMMSFRALCKEIARNRRSKLVSCVADAFLAVYAPPLTRENIPDPQRSQAIGRFNSTARVPLIRTPLCEPSSSDPKMSHLQGWTLKATPINPRMVMDGSVTEWTDTQLYLQFLDQLCLRVPGLPIEINDASSPPSSRSDQSISRRGYK